MTLFTSDFVSNQPKLYCHFFRIMKDFKICNLLHMAQFYNLGTTSSKHRNKTTTGLDSDIRFTY